MLNRHSDAVNRQLPRADARRGLKFCAVNLLLAMNPIVVDAPQRQKFRVVSREIDDVSLAVLTIVRNDQRVLQIKERQFLEGVLDAGDIRQIARLLRKGDRLISVNGEESQKLDRIEPVSGLIKPLSRIDLIAGVGRYSR